MTPDEIKTAVDAAVGNKVILTYPQLILFVLLAGIGAYFGAYLKMKGKNLAKKEDLEELTRKIEEIKTEYSRELEDYRHELSRRTQAARISEALARACYGDGSQPREYVQLVWELSIWLPPELVRKLTVCLVDASQGKANPKDVLIEARKLLHGDSDDLTAEQIIHLDLTKAEQGGAGQRR